MVQSIQMSSAGKRIRWSRFRYPQSRFGLIVPIDHGLTVGPMPGLESVAQVGRWIAHPGITGIIAHKGIVERLAAHDCLRGLGVMVHVNGMSTLAPAPDTKEMLTTVESALRLGADGVSLQVNFDGSNDGHNLRLLGGVVDAAAAYGLPVLSMVYDKVETRERGRRVERMRHLMRIAVELGTDAIKIAAPDDLRELPELLSGLCEDAAIFVAGGAKRSDAELYELTAAAAAAGASGLCVGRNVFQRPSPAAVLDDLSAILRRAELRLSERLSEPALSVELAVVT
ncbi:MAG TPA: aldolase [Thermoanaerobaculia bacterium]|jgi:class I fructose-bisphosphate aldolase/fructose-bisphosphate aldolase/2-amino-3,7-dideoxy-D-threo-hept-6-ulosonate synthase|nr:aldolase [Thermoanaerobaculia bacterium]